MATVVFKFFARQGTGRTDRQSGDYMLPPLGRIKMYVAQKSDDNLSYTWFILFWNMSKAFSARGKLYPRSVSWSTKHKYSTTWKNKHHTHYTCLIELTLATLDHWLSIQFS